MTIVVDANLLIVLVTGDPRRRKVRDRFRRWLRAGESLHAPALLSYEVASGLTRLVGAGRLSPEGVAPAWRAIGRVPIRQHLLESSQARVVEVATELRRRSAYDAAYIVLAQQLGGELWTLDGPLARNAESIGFSVRLIA